VLKIFYFEKKLNINLVRISQNFPKLSSIKLFFEKFLNRGKEEERGKKTKNKKKFIIIINNNNNK